MLTAVLALQLVAGSANPGLWAGTFATPGSIAAMRLTITSPTAFADSIIINLYGEERVYPVRNLRLNGDSIAFTTEMYNAELRLTGRIGADRMGGSVAIAADARSGTGEWELRRVQPALPKPTGPFAVGTRDFYWTDESRAETITEDANDKRKLFVRVWSPDKSNTASPLIIFSPGLGSSIAKYITLIENLASHGFVVAAINHAYDAGAFTFSDGQTVRYVSEIWDRPVSDTTWTAEARKQFFDERRRGWAADVSFVITQLTNMKVATGNIGALGHSFGGQAASLACAEDRRLKACVNLDGLAQGAAFLPNAKGENLQQPFAFFTTARVSDDYDLRIMGLSRSEYDARERNRMLNHWKPSLKTRLQALEQGTHFVVIRGATHQSFSDIPLLEPHPKNETLADRQRRAAIINEYVLAFFDQFLRGRSSQLLNGRDGTYPEAVFELQRAGGLKW